MIQGLRKKIIVEEDGKLEIKSPELHKGDKIEVIMLVNPEEETEYLLSTEANRMHIREAMQQLKERKSYVYVDPDKL
jgi:antitoxin YefM